MKFVRIIDGFDHLWAVKAQDKEADELTILFRNWTNGEYLLDFFMENMDDLKATSILNDSMKPSMIRLKTPRRYRNLFLKFPIRNILTSYSNRLTSQTPVPVS